MLGVLPCLEGLNNHAIRFRLPQSADVPDKFGHELVNDRGFFLLWAGKTRTSMEEQSVRDSSRRPSRSPDETGGGVRTGERIFSRVKLFRGWNSRRLRVETLTRNCRYSWVRDYGFRLCLIQGSSRTAATEDLDQNNEGSYQEYHRQKKSSD